MNFVTGMFFYISLPFLSVVFYFGIAVTNFSSMLVFSLKPKFLIFRNFFRAYVSFNILSFGSFIFKSSELSVLYKLSHQNSMMTLPKSQSKLFLKIDIKFEVWLSYR